MIDVSSAVTILAMVDTLREQGSWAGETHVQKAMFFLDKKCAVPTGYDFVLYKHGPYSFELHDSLATLFSSCLLEHQIQPPYGPRIRLTASGEAFLKQNADQLALAHTPIQTVAQWFEKKGVSDLEKLATALWLRNETPGADDADLAQAMHRIKPHISPVEARQALQDEAALHL